MDSFKAEINKNRLAFTYFLILSVIAALFLVKQLKLLGIEDWDQRYLYTEAARISILKYGQFPLWNPYHCGGMTQIGHVLNDFLSPLFFIPLIAGPVVGYKLLFVVHLFFGLIGLYYLGLYYKISKPGSVLLSSVYMFSGLIILPFGAGMSDFINFCFLPALLLFYLRALREKGWTNIIYSSLIMTLIFLGGYHYFIQILLFLFVITVLEFFQTKNTGSVRIFILFIIFFSFLSAVKLLPSIETTLNFPRVIKEDMSGYSFRSLSMSLFSPDQSFEGLQRWNAHYGIDENGMYVGLFSLYLFLLGVFSKGKKHQELIIIFLLFLILSLGLSLNPSLYEFLHSFPVLDNMRMAQRYRYFFMISFVLFVGFGFDLVNKLLNEIIGDKKIVYTLTALAGCSLIFHLAWVNLSFFKEAFNIPLLKIRKTENFIQRCGIAYYDKNGATNKVSHHTSYSDEYIYLLAGYGSTSCYEPVPVTTNVQCQNAEEYRGEYFLENNSGKIKLLSWSPNRLHFKANVKKPDLLFINQNYDRGWQVKKNNLKSKVKNKNGLIAVEVYPEDKTVDLYYFPTSFVKGLLISIISAIILVIFYLKKINGRQLSHTNSKTQPHQGRLSGN